MYAQWIKSVLSSVFLMVPLFAHQVHSETICTDTSSTSNSGTLYDSGGSSSDYDHNETCGFLIQPSSTSNIILSFSDFEYENSYDTLTIYDGSSDSGALLGTYTGSTLPGDVTATSGAMYIVHDSDYSIKELGFVATWAIGVSPPVAEWHFDESSWSGSSGEVVDAQGNLSGIAVNGATTIDSGQVCGAATFDGSDDYLNIENLHTYLNATASLSFWMNTSQKGNNSYWAAPGITGIEESSKSSNDMFWGYFRSNRRMGFGQGGSNHIYSSKATNDGSWRHVVLTRDSVSHALEMYLDGVLISSGIGRDDDATLSYSSIGRIEDTGGTPAYFAGHLDEMLIFDRVVTAEEIASIYTHQSAGNNWDGSIRDCDPELLVELRFEESTWDGSSDEVIDSSGNDNHGRLLYNATPDSGNPAVDLGNGEGSCDYANFSSGSILLEDLAVSTVDDAKTTVTFWMYWDGTDQSMPIGWSYYDLWFRGDSFGFNTWNNDIYGISSSTLSGGWHHIAAEFTNGSNKVTSNSLWVDGIKQILTQQRGSPSSSSRSVGGDFKIGGAVNSSSYRFDGLLDELRIYNAVLSTSQIVNIMNDTHPCPVRDELGYFSIAHDQSAAYCLNETIDVTAHKSDTSTLGSYSGTITLDTQTGTGTWLLASGNGSLLDSVEDDGIATYTFDSLDSGVASFYLFYDTGSSTVNIDVFDGSVQDDDSEGDLSFSPTGFSITASALPTPPVTPINDAIADQSSAVAFNVHIAAYGVDPDNGQCGIIETYSGDKAISISTDYQNPSSGTLSALGAGVVSFTNGQGVISTQYNDVGQISVLFSDGELSGQSSAFVVKPTDFSISVTDNPSTTSSGEGFMAAGESFTAEVQALNSLGDVVPNFGNESSPESVQVAIDELVFPTGGEVGLLSNGDDFSSSTGDDSSWVFCATEGDTCTLPSASTVRYGANESYVSQADIEGSITCSNSVFGDPIYGVLKQCEYQLNAQVAKTFTNNSVSWDQVGSITLMASIADGDYLGSGDISSTASNTIGRFYPHSFLLSGESVENSCNNFTYLSHPDLSVAYTLSAITANGDTASNYDNGLGYPVGIIDYQAELANSGVNLGSRFTANDATWSEGEYTVIDNNAMFARSSLLEAPLNDVIFSVSVDDSDDVGLMNPNTNAATSDDCSIDDSCDAATIGSASFYYGRLALSDAYGPETAALPVSFTTQYWNGQQYILNVFDDCSAVSRTAITFNGASIDSLSALSVDLLGGISQSQWSSLSSTTIDFVGGDAGLSFSAPGTSITLDSIYIDVDLSLIPWLSSDWNQDNNTTNDLALPTATIQFKTYRGHDRILYWKHKY